MGNKLCDAYAGVIVSACLFAGSVKSQDVIIDGVRRKNEFESVAHMFDLIVYVDREDSSSVSSDNFELHEYKTDERVTLIDNNREVKDMVWDVLQSIKSLREG